MFTCSFNADWSHFLLGPKMAFPLSSVGYPKVPTPHSLLAWAAQFRLQLSLPLHPSEAVHSTVSQARVSRLLPDCSVDGLLARGLNSSHFPQCPLTPRETGASLPRQGVQGPLASPLSGPESFLLYTPGASCTLLGWWIPHFQTRDKCPGGVGWFESCSLYNHQDCPQICLLPGRLLQVRRGHVTNLSMKGAEASHVISE